MRTTLRIDDDLMMELKATAKKEKLSLNRLIDRIIRRGLKVPPGKPASGRFREKVFSMGEPSVANLNKALALASALEDEEALRKMSLRK